MASGDFALLAALGDRLRDLGFETQMSASNAEGPDQLFLLLSPDEHGRSLQLQLLFLGDLTDPSILQYYVGLPTRVRAGSTASVTRFLNAANAALPIGTFGLLEEDAVLYFRANVPTVIDPLDVHLVSWTVKMVDFTVSSLRGLIEQLAMGLDFDLARRLLEETLAHLMEA